MIDSHAHYDDEQFNPDRDEILAKAYESGVTHIVNPGCSVESSKASLKLAHKWPFVYAGVGIHPHEASSMDDHSVSVLEEMARDKKVVAVGEVGLDYHYDFSPREVQKECLARQIALARKLGLPLILHDRESHRDILDLIRSEKAYEAGGVFHCFSGSVEMAREVLELGFYLGIGGSLTFKNAVKPVEVAAYAPFDRLLLETDCPYMAPVPHRGKRNWSGLMGPTLEKIAAIKGVTVNEAERKTAENAVALFKLSGK